MLEKVVLKLKLQKCYFNKKSKYAPKLLFFNQNKIRKIRMIFYIENSFWKFNVCTLGPVGKASL